MVESAALLMTDILPQQLHRQWVLSVLYPLRWLFAQNPEVMGKALKVVIRVISSYLIKRAGKRHTSAKTGAVTLIQRFGSALSLSVHFHMLFIDAVYVTPGKYPIFQRIKAPTGEGLTDLVQQISVRISDIRTQWLNRA